MTITELSRRIGIPRRHIQYLIAEGIMPRPEGSRRFPDYGQAHVDAWRRYESLRAQGYSPAQIKVLPDGPLAASAQRPMRTTTAGQERLIASGGAPQTVSATQDLACDVVPAETVRVTPMPGVSLTIARSVIAMLGGLPPNPPLSLPAILRRLAAQLETMPTIGAADADALNALETHDAPHTTPDANPMTEGSDDV